MHCHFRCLFLSAVLLGACDCSDLPPEERDAQIDVLRDATNDITDTSISDVLPVPDVPDAVVLACDDAFRFEPNNAIAGEQLRVFVRNDEGFGNIGLALVGPGNPSSRFVQVGRPTNSYFEWEFDVVGHMPGTLAMTFTKDMGVAVSECEILVLPADGDASVPDASVPDAGECTCSGKLCGEDDGCGTPCAGGHRDSTGAASDCRAGDCGCGIGNNDNMVCGGDGQCVVRCPCDCLPPVRVLASRVSALDGPGACRLVFKESGDPTVYDFAADQPLCPVGPGDIQGSNRCTQCPPCHRPRPPAEGCSNADYCACVDPTYRMNFPDYNAVCGG